MNLRRSPSNMTTLTVLVNLFKRYLFSKEVERGRKCRRSFPVSIMIVTDRLVDNCPRELAAILGSIPVNALVQFGCLVSSVLKEVTECEW